MGFQWKENHQGCFVCVFFCVSALWVHEHGRLLCTHIGGLESGVCLCVRASVHVSMHRCIYVFSVLTPGPYNQHWARAWQGCSPPPCIVGPQQPGLKTTLRTKWVNSVWHVFNMVTLEQAAFDWKANIQAMQIINHGKRPINYSIKQSNSRINVGKRRGGWGGSQQRGRRRERAGNIKE